MPGLPPPKPRDVRSPKAKVISTGLYLHVAPIN